MYENYLGLAKMEEKIFWLVRSLGIRQLKSWKLLFRDRDLHIYKKIRVSMLQLRGTISKFKHKEVKVRVVLGRGLGGYILRFPDVGRIYFIAN